MQLLIVNYEFPPIGGGAATACYELCKQLAKRDDVNLTLLYGADKSLVQFPVISGANYIPVYYKRNSPHNVGVSGLLEFLYKGQQQLQLLLSAQKIDIIHYFFSVPTGLLSFIHRDKVPYIISHRGGDVPSYNKGEFQLLHKLLFFANRLVVRKAEVVCAVSNALSEASEKKFGKNVETIPNGVAFSNSLLKEKINNSNLCLIAVGRLIALKQFDQLIQAISALPLVTLEIIGTGSEGVKLQALIDRLELGNRVKMRGLLSNDEVKNSLQQAHIFILPSVNEGMSMAVLEAMAEGLPIIGGDGGGMPELIKHGENGFLINPDDIEQIRQSINYYVDNKDKVYQHGLCSLNRVKNEFSWSHVAEKYINVYQRVLNHEK